MNNEFGFVDAYSLLLATILPLLAGLLWILERRRDTLLTTLSAGSVTKPQRAKLLMPLSLALILIISAARPYSGYQDIDIPSNGRDIMLIVDVSRSMLARDVLPSRLEFEKRKIRDISDWISRNTAGDRIGIILFAGESYVYAPLTSDYAVIKYFVQSISPEMITSNGSAISSAVEATIKAFADTKSQSPLLVLLSDGEDDQLQIDKTVGLLKDAKLTLNALGIGTVDGKPIELASGYFLKDNSGNVVISKLNEQSLRALAEGSGGKYLHAALDDADIERILRPPLSIVSARNEKTRTIRVYHEFGHWLLLGAMGMMTALLFARRPHLIFAVTLCLALPKQSFAQEGTPSDNKPVPELHESYNLYNQGKFEEALPGFQAGAAQQPDDPDIAEALGSTLFRLNRPNEAIKAYSDEIERAKDGRRKFSGYYNRGNANLQAQKFKEAIADYVEGLKIKPGDEKTSHNMQIARQLLEEREQKEKQEQEKREKNEQKQDQDQKDSEQNQDPDKQKKEEENKTGEQKEDQEQKQGEKDEADKDSSNQNQSTKQDEGDKDESQKQDGSPSPQPSVVPSAVPSAAAPQDQAGATPTAQGGEGQSDRKEEKSDNKQQDSESKQRNDASESPEQNQRQKYDAQAMKEQEARAWLDSLSDAPLILRKKTSSSRTTSRQSW